MSDYQRLNHEFSPVYNKESRILILGTFPSVKSREQNFYYGHPQNRFWKVLAHLTKEPLPTTINEKQQLLLSHRIAVWDVIQSCEIIGSSDSSIRDVIPADLKGLLTQTSISAIFGNGAKACQLFEKYTAPALLDFPKLQAIKKLPSTSPANASWSLERLCRNWQEQLQPYLQS
ncbi:MAG: DNA-deoxyinosine glycosylase [Lachnospiraceae bacterium]|nr:DNA-deoxyinosine glycosylase [Lachnospiraceae bacterium]